ncbi:MAG: MetS family NSS transporter small subunit [Melioribacteraceae bacterium]|nr:MetS family NSS transporter small subunit [Melioribacteraceae bacterium]
MNFITVLTMVLVAGIVWGGFIFFLTIAIKKEKRKRLLE